MHGHGSARAERVCSDVFWGKAKSGHSHSQAPGSDDGDDVGCADGAEAMIGGIIADGYTTLFRSANGRVSHIHDH